MRGFDADLIIIDEAAFISFDLLTYTIIPVATQRLTSLLMLSTPSGDSSQSYFTRLMELKDKATGQLCFHVVRIGVACEDCEAEGTPWKCDHVANENPWMSSTKKRRLSKFYEGNEDRNQQENYGMFVQSANMAYNTALVKSFHEQELYHVESTPKVMFLAIDPSGGGPSDMAFTLAFEDHGMMIVSIYFFPLFFTPVLFTDGFFFFFLGFVPSRFSSRRI